MDKIGFEELARQRIINADTLLEEIVDALESKYKDEELEKRKVQLKALCRKLPSAIHDSGLVITLLYLSKKKENKDLDNHSDSDSKEAAGEGIKLKLAAGMIEWLKFYQSIWMDNEEENLLLYLADNCSVEELLVLTREAIAFSHWLKRSAENFL